jgi:Protein of unknown function (DUF3102)
MSTALAPQDDRRVARPLKELSRLIKAEVEAGKRTGLEAYEHAAKPFYQRAGELLIEAKSQLSQGEWLPWLQRQGFGFTTRTAQNWIRYAEEIQQKRRPPTLFDKPPTLSEIAQPNYDFSLRPSAQAKKEIQDHVTNRITPGFVDRMAQARAEEEKELRLVRELTIQLIDAGYKVLSMKLHPDRGGEADAMSRLTRAKNRIKRLNMEEGL